MHDFVSKKLPVECFPGCKLGHFFRTAHRITSSGSYAASVTPNDLGALAWDGDYEMLAIVKEIENAKVSREDQFGRGSVNSKTSGEIFRGTG